MVVRGVGRVLRFEISPRILFWASLFLALYILASILVINRYFDLRRENKALSEEVTDARDQAERVQRDLYRAEQQVGLLEEYLSGLETGKANPVVAAKAASQGTVAPYAGPPPKEVASGELRKAESSVESMVDVRDLTTRFEDQRVGVAFKVVNIREGEGPVRGYVHMIAVDEKSNPPRFRSYPKTTLRNGRPVNFKRGQIFFIKRFKTVRGEFRLEGPGDRPTRLFVLVYNHDGRLLLEKEFEVGNDA